MGFTTAITQLIMFIVTASLVAGLLHMHFTDVSEVNEALSRQRERLEKKGGTNLEFESATFCVGGWKRQAQVTVRNTGTTSLRIDCLDLYATKNFVEDVNISVIMVNNTGINPMLWDPGEDLQISLNSSAFVNQADHQIKIVTCDGVSFAHSYHNDTSGCIEPEVPPGPG